MESKKTQLEVRGCLLPVRVGPSVHWPSLCLGLVLSTAKAARSGREAEAIRSICPLLRGLPGVGECIGPGPCGPWCPCETSEGPWELESGAPRTCSLCAELHRGAGGTRDF